MPAIRCKACGKTYDSREGFCPKCGAYNRPPRREWVDAGGDVHYAEQEKVCYEQKECHEEKVCYENQTRRPRPHIQWHVPKKNTASGAIGAVIAVSIVIVLINTLRGVSGDIFDRNEPMPDYDWSTPKYVGEAVASAREYAEMGECFTLEGVRTAGHREAEGNGSGGLLYRLGYPDEAAARTAPLRGLLWTGYAQGRRNPLR